MIHDGIRAIILNAIEGENEKMHLVNPIAPGVAPVP